ncbi:MAG: AsnC family transcriptional regulator [Gammaproteobacteria bacterium]|nr:AsnC family transcriptional regulator [Gammaproteobacteria bacterium]
MTNSSKPGTSLNHISEMNDGDQLLRIPTRDTLDDKLNQQIIAMLEIDGRLPFKEIAKTLDVSEGTVRNRVNRLKDAGVLQIKALVDRSAINYATDSMLGIKVAPTSSPSEVAKRLQNCSEIVFIIWVTGRYDLLVEIVSDGDDTLCRFLEEHCFNKDDISNIEVMKGLTTYKNQFLLKSHEKI